MYRPTPSFPGKCLKGGAWLPPTVPRCLAGVHHSRPPRLVDLGPAHVRVDFFDPVRQSDLPPSRSGQGRYLRGFPVCLRSQLPVYEPREVGGVVTILQE